MLIERQKRMSRVRFKHPIRVVTLEGQPRVIRTLTANVSRKGLFLRMPEPLPLGTKVALSLEAGGRALALAQAEVVWGRVHESQLPGRFPGCGVRFTEFMHPRAQELVDYLVHNLDRGKPLLLAPRERAWTRWLPAAGGVALLACAALATLLFLPSSTPEVLDEPAGPTLEMVAAPTVHAAPEPVAVAPPVNEVAAAPALQEAADEPAARIVTAPTPRIAERPGVPEVREAEVRPAALAPAPTRDAPVAKEVPAGPVIVTSKAKAAPLIPASGEGGKIKLPSGAAPSLAWTLKGSELRLSPELLGQAQVTRAFVLAGPPRAVFDLSGAPPSRSHTVAASPPYSTAVRLGKLPSGTRLVIDLDTAPKRSSQDGSSLVLSF